MRENRYVLEQDAATLRQGHDLLADPGVAATVIYCMAQSHALVGRAAPDAFYAPFAPNRLPPGVSPAAVLGTIRNSQAKFLGTWATAVLRGQERRDVIDLVEIYGAAFPAERAEVTTRSLAELTALTAEVVAGKRSLRQVLAAPPPKRE